MKYTKPFKSLGKNDALSAGGKGASLGEMLNAGIPVPDGFVVLSTTFDAFLHTSDLVQEIDAILDGVNHKAVHSIDGASEKIQDLIKHAQMPKDIAEEIQSQFKILDSRFVAVRSSATAEDGADHAWAGQLESYLNTTEGDLLEKVQHCWASLFTPRAIFYRFEKGLHTTKISVAVVIQKMVNSEKSGIAFSVHPVTEDRNQLIIEAGFGLGEAIVSGSVTPDSYVVEKEPRKIIDINVSNQTRALYRKEGGGNEWINLENTHATSQVLTESEILAFSEIILKIESHYCFPCDIEWAYEKGKFYITQSRPITTLKSVDDSLKVPTFFKDKDEYFSWGRWVGPVLEHETWIDWCNTDEAKEFELIHETPGATTVDGNFFLQKDGSYQKMKEIVREEFQTGNFSVAHKILDLSKKLSEECVSMAHSLPREIAFDDFIKAFALMSKIRFPWTECFPIGDAGEEFVNKYATEHNLKIEDITSLIPNLPNSLTDDQKELTKLKAQIEQEKLLFDILEIEKINPKLAEEIKVYQKKTEYLGTHHFWGDERSIERLMDAIKNSSPKQDTEMPLGKSQKEFDIIAEATKWRLECAQSSSYLAYAFRPFLTNLAKKHGLEYGDLIFLLTSEIKNLSENDTDVLPLIRERQKAYGLTKINGEFHIAIDQDLHKWKEHFGLLEVHEHVEEFKGSIGNKGFVTGRVVIVFKPSDQAKVLPGMVLVAPETTPDYIPSMGKAIAFVTDQGGITSHAAIVAREMGKPCITGTKIASSVLKDGDLVEVDANNGIVRILESKPVLPRWEKILQRNFPPFALTTSGRFEFEGYKIGPMTWVREREILIRYNTVQMYMIQDPSAFYISNINDLLDKEYPDFEKEIDKINKDVYEGVRVAPGKTLKDLKELNELHRYMYGVMLIGFDVATDIKAKIDEVIKNHEIDFYSHLETPIQKTGVQREKDAIADAGKNPSDKILKKLSHDFGYLHQDYMGQPWRLEDYEKVCNDSVNLASGMHEDFNISNFSPYEQYLVKIFRKFLYMYEEARNGMVRVCWAMKENIGTLGYDPEKMLFMTETEVKLFAEGTGEYITDELLEKRKEAFAMYFEAGKYHEYTGEDDVWKLIQDQKIEYIWKEEKQDATMLKGTIAYKGKVTGKVRIVFTQQDANQIEDGEILISPMTQIEFLSGIRKCGAIVTDEGGIICHAAIIAREFGKPCILNTQKATKVFKNGDTVEVDANIGVVRTIKKGVILAQKFIDELDGVKSILPLNNYSLFVFGSGYNTFKYFGKVFKSKPNYTLFNIRYNDYTQTFLSEDAWKQYATEVFSRYLKNFNHINLIKENFYKNFPEIDNLYSKYTYEYIDIQKEEDLLLVVERDYDLFWTTNAWSHFSIYFDLDFCYSIVQSIYPGITKKDIESIWHNATDMVAESFDKAQKRDILNYIINNDNDTNLIEHCQYFWTSYKNVFPLEKVKEEIIKNYGIFLNNQQLASEEIKKMDKELKEKRYAFESWKDNISDIQKSVADYCQIVMQVRDERKNHFSKGITVAWRIAEKLFNTVNVDKNLIENILPFEELMKGSNFIASIKEELEKRNNNYVVYVPYIGPKEISYENIAENHKLINSYFITDREKQTKEIRGQVGNKGIVKGKVRIIRSIDQFGKFQEGEILVAGMTRPEYVSLMRLAKAIITDEGSITCHAAIVSRELNKPCVIGTKFATQILKDGDLVEVDANSGIVKIIS